MGLDHGFMKTKKCAGELGKEADYPSLEDKEQEDIIWFRKNYELDDFMRDEYGWSDYVNITKEELKEILKSLYKKDNEKYKNEEEIDVWEISHLREAEKVIETILILFDFEQYDLWYWRCG